MLNKIRSEELGFKDLFNYGFDIFIKNFKYIMILALIVYIPMNALALIIPDHMLLTDADLMNLYDIDIVKLYYNAGIYVAMMCFFTPLLYGGLTGLVQDVVSEKAVSLSSVFSGSIEKIGKHIVTSVLYFLLVGFTAILIVPAIYFSIVYRFYAHAVGATGRWGLGAFAVSAMIVKGRWIKTFGFIILTVLFSVTVSNLFGTVLSLLFGSFASGRIGNVVYSTILNLVDVYFEVVIALYFVNRMMMFQKRVEQSKLNNII